MSRRATGALFCFIASLLFCTKYICAAVYSTVSTNYSPWSEETFHLWLGYIGPIPTILSVISLIIGVIYLASAEMSDRKNKHEL